jgi:type IV pilus assembly protein PilX
MHRYPSVTSLPGHQRGMALIVSLIFLLLMTLIGISSMQNASLQEKMAGGVKFRNESFQVAEAALRAGENAVAVSTFTLAACTTVAACAPPPDSTAMTGAGSGSNVTWVAVTGTQGFYGVQNIGTTLAPINAPTGCTSASTTLYRITAVGFSGPSRSVVESVYGKC